jgi:hypothetical protein
MNARFYADAWVAEPMLTTAAVASNVSFISMPPNQCVIFPPMALSRGLKAEGSARFSNSYRSKLTQCSLATEGVHGSL